MNLAHALTSRPGDRRPFVIAQLLDVDAEGNRALVSIDGSAGTWLPFVPNVYDGVNTVYVLRDVGKTGAGQLVLGPCYEVAEPPPPPPPPPATPDEPSLVTDTALIRPTWSGTWRVIRGSWDRWNVSRYGGRSTLYQGSAYGSGTLVGLAVYGDAVKALGAVAIDSITVSTPTATGSGDVTVQGAPHGSKPSGAPSPSGDTASGGSSVTLSAAMREAFRTGAARSLATVGGNYRATYGTSKANGMALSIKYRRPA